MATPAMEHRIGTTADGPTGVGGREQQADHRTNRQIVEVISDEGSLLNAHPQLLLQGGEGGRLVFDADQAMADAELPGPHLRCSSLATTEKGDLKPRLLHQANPQTIAHIEALAQLPRGVKPKATIGEHAIHVQHKQLNRSQAMPQ